LLHRRCADERCSDGKALPSSMQVLLTSGIISQSSRTVTLLSFSIVSSTFAIVSSETDGCPSRITERNSHLAGEASGSTISNGCQAKTERHRQLAGVWTGRGGTKLHASVAGSRVTAFLATAAPWEPYFTDNPRTLVREST
jgi:hypothetical protein